MRESLPIFVDQAVAAFQLRGPVYEFRFDAGEQLSGDAPASQASLREFFPDGRLVAGTLDEEGFRQHAGHPTRLALGDGAARTAVCLNVLERLWDPQPIVREIGRILAPGGIALVISSAADDTSAAGEPDGTIDGRPLQPRFLRELLSDLEATLVGWQGTADDPHTVLGVGFKAPISAHVAEGMRRFLDRFPAELAQRRRYPPWYRHVRRALALCRGSAQDYRHWRDYYATQFMFDLGGHCSWESLATLENAAAEE